MNFQLTNGQAQPIPAGRYAAKIQINTGTVGFEYQLLSEPFENIPDMDNFTQTISGVAELPMCKIRANITGDATVTLARIGD